MKLYDISLHLTLSSDETSIAVKSTQTSLLLPLENKSK